jgi:hypothetical protein
MLLLAYVKLIAHFFLAQDIVYIRVRITITILEISIVLSFI